ncbi:MAG TPA: protein kinase [Acidobacteriota bacterium]|nr:protein kinase [Acidobacteriota bacterium]
MQLFGQSISHYAILERLGEGGMGVVYKAEDTRLKRTVALKFLKDAALGSGEDRARFLREAQAAAVLDHPNICTVYEVDERDGHTFISMAYCSGRTLKDIVREGKLSIPEALTIAVQAAEGLDEAHGKGVIHRDIKGANIMVSPKGQVKIMDFGIAKISGGSESTWSGTVSGTAAYMSPEQAMGGPIDGRTDIWSLGVVLYEMITGELPFRGDTEAGVFHSLLYETPRPIRESRPDCPPDLADIIDRCLKKKADARYPTAKACLADLRAVQHRLDRTLEFSATGTERRKARRDLATRTQHRDPRRRRRQRVLAVLGAVALAIAADFAVPSLRRGLGALVGYRPVAAEKHLLVLPFLNVGGEKAGQDLCDGFLEVLTSELTRLERFQKAFWVAPANEVRTSGVVSAREARRAFGANLVLAGSFQRVGGEVTLTMNLIEARTLRQVRSEVVTGSMSGFASFQGTLLEGAVRMLDMEIPPEVQRTLAAGGTTNAAAYESYVMGCGRLERYENPESLTAAIDLFQRAVALDSGYALAFAGLGEARWRMSELTSDPALVEQALDDCGRALKIAPDLASVHATLGLIDTGKGLTAEAIREFEQALRSDPVNQEATLGLAEAWEASGKREKAEEIYQKAIALKPSRWAGYSHLGVFYLNTGRLAEAEAMFQKVLDLTPDNTRALNNLMAVYWYMKRDDLVRRTFERSVAVRPNADAYSNMGTIEFFTRHYGEAVKMFELSVRIEAGLSTIWGNLADSYRYVPGSADKARHAYDRAILLAGRERESNPRDASLRARLALYLAYAGRDGDALTELDEALRLVPASPVVLRKSVLIYEQLGMRAKALSAATRFLGSGGASADLEADPDLARMIGDPEFRKLAREARPGTQNK